MSTAFFLRFCVLLALLLASNAVGVHVPAGSWNIISCVFQGNAAVDHHGSAWLIIRVRLESFSLIAAGIVIRFCRILSSFIMYQSSWTSKLSNNQGSMSPMRLSAHQLLFPFSNLQKAGTFASAHDADVLCFGPAGKKEDFAARLHHLPTEEAICCRGCCNWFWMLQLTLGTLEKLGQNWRGPWRHCSRTLSCIHVEPSSGIITCSSFENPKESTLEFPPRACKLGPWYILINLGLHQSP